MTLAAKLEDFEVTLEHLLMDVFMWILHLADKLSYCPSLPNLNLGDFQRKEHSPAYGAWDQKGRGGALAGMAAGPLGSEDLLSAWDRLVWGLTCRALRTCQGGNVRVLQLMLKPWCISRAVYQTADDEVQAKEKQEDL
ncbi:hypothetical protein MJG53_011576 [Ovis ammon polii x Ovis aries]|uniref:Uncharacterized protein n=1 Tax=Ovis ammon polii x Ovis aries TaxID=2918886 RepID=A0ACB9UNM5_9CETA|nr:hypothetical protein MJG53_011576 [Ovis ammon polii x Ovis aries]